MELLMNTNKKIFPLEFLMKSLYRSVDSVLFFFFKSLYLITLQMKVTVLKLCSTLSAFPENDSVKVFSKNYYDVQFSAL